MDDWKPATYDQVIFAFLRAEAYRLKGGGIELSDDERKCLAAPDLKNDEENETRRVLVLDRLGRSGILGNLPADTIWHEASLRESDLYTNVYVIFDKHWLTLAAHRFRSLDAPDNWAHMILWAHSKEGPFTILEGNTRLTQAAAAYRSGDLRLPVYVGLSKSFFPWHTPDQLGLCVHLPGEKRAPNDRS